MSTCTPRFKQDAHNAWVTQDGDDRLCIWLHPQSPMTLEDAAKVIDNYNTSTRRQYSHLVPDLVVENMTFRGQTITRSQMVNDRAVDFMKDNEPFSLLYRIIPRVSTWSLLCPCCAKPRDSAGAPQAQHMSTRT